VASVGAEPLLQEAEGPTHGVDVVEGLVVRGELAAHLFIAMYAYRVSDLRRVLALGVGRAVARAGARR